MTMRLVLERRSRHWTQKELADLVGLYDASTVSRWEARQRRPYDRNAKKLEALFGLSVDELFSPVDDEEAKP